MARNKDKFNFFVPFTFCKGEDGEENNEIWIEGICSSMEQDSDGEWLEPLGFDFKSLLTKGFFNWDHQAKKTSAAIVGEPTEAKVVNSGQDFYIKGFLYGDLEEARHIGTLAAVLEKASKTRRLGFSIEGVVLEKDLLNPKRIKRARITGCAITPCPKNPNTLLKLIKGEYTEAFQEPESDVDLDICPKCNEETIVDGKCTKCGYIQKAMEVNIDINPESVEHKTSPKVGLCLSKSEVYDLIVSSYTNDVSQAREIYSFIKSVNQNLFPMNTNDNKVSPEALQKAFSFLDDAIVLQKSDSGKKEEKEKKPAEATGKEPDNKGADDDDDDDLDEGDANGGEDKKDKDKAAAPETAPPAVKKGDSDDEDDETFDKAATMCNDLMKAGKKKDEMVEEMEKGGIPKDIAEAVADACIADASANKDGGKITTAVAPKTEKSENAAALLQEGTIHDLEKSFSDTQELIKGLGTSFERKFGAMGTIMKSVVEQNQALNTHNVELEKSMTALAERLEKVENTSTGSKSARSAKQVERFAKSEGASAGENGTTTYSLSSATQRRQLLNEMTTIAVAAREKGSPNAMLESAASMLELTKSMTRDVLPILRANKIEVTE